MKRIIMILIPLAVVAISMLSGCKKKENEFPSHTSKVSFPVITLLGPQDTTISRGATWVDPGATWVDTITGESGTLKATAINTSVDSAYMLIYTATNKNGFQSYVARGLGVTNYNGALDISGAYTVNGSTVNIYKVSRALFLNPNADGYGAGDSSVMVIKSDSSISVATIGTYITGTVGAPIPETFSQASIIYQPAYYYSGIPPRLTAQPPVIFSYTVTILNVPPATVSFAHN